MLVLNMPCGAIQVIEPKKLLWMRNALPDERVGAVMLLVAGDRLYSIDTLSQLIQKFKAAKIPIASFTAPDREIDVAVNAAAVGQVNKSNPLIYHERAGAVLQFTPKLKLAVREQPDRRLLGGQSQGHTDCFQARLGTSREGCALQAQ